MGLGASSVFWVCLGLAAACGPVSRAKKIEINPSPQSPGYRATCKLEEAKSLGIGPVEWPDDVTSGDQGRPFILATRKDDFFPEIYRFAGTWQRVSPTTVGGRKLSVWARPHLQRRGQKLYFMGYENLADGTQRDWLVVGNVTQKSFTTRAWPAGTINGAIFMDGDALIHAAYLNAQSKVRISESRNDGESWTTKLDVECGGICEVFDIQKKGSELFILLSSPFGSEAPRVIVLGQVPPAIVETIGSGYPADFHISDRPELYVVQGELYAFLTFDHGNQNLTVTKVVYRRNAGRWTSVGTVSANEMLGDASLFESSGRYFLYERDGKGHRLLEGHISQRGSAVLMSAASGRFRSGSISRIWTQGAGVFLFGVDSNSQLVEQPISCKN